MKHIKQNAKDRRILTDNTMTTLTAIMIGKVTTSNLLSFVLEKRTTISGIVKIKIVETSIRSITVRPANYKVTRNKIIHIYKRN
jgi:hypothetical protein